MISISNQTARIPSGFAMPMCGGHVGVDETFLRSAAFGKTVLSLSARDRKAALITGDMGAVVANVAYFPGTSAWSPPIC